MSTREPDRRHSRGRRAGETGVLTLEGPPLVTCAHCGSAVPAGDFCGHCGAHLPTASRRRHHAFAAVPSQPVAHLSIITTLFPHLPHRRGRPFQLALVAGGAIVIVLAMLHLFAPATVAAVCVIPVLYLIYLYEVEVYENEPWLVVGVTMFAGVVLGFAFTTVFGGALAGFEITGDTTTSLVLTAVAIPLASQALMLLGPMCLYLFRPRFREPLDGMTFGAAAALGFTLASSLTAYWPLISGPLVAQGSTVDWAVRLTRSGLLIMLINASTTALVTASVWMHRYDRRRTMRPWQSNVLAAIVVAFGVQVALGIASFAVTDLFLDVAVLAIAAVALLLYVRLVIHQSLLVEGAVHEIGPDAPCPECHRVVPAMAFCPACGAARSASPKPGRPRLPLGA